MLHPRRTGVLWSWELELARTGDIWGACEHQPGGGRAWGRSLLETRASGFTARLHFVLIPPFVPTLVMPEFLKGAGQRVGNALLGLRGMAFWGGHSKHSLLH